MKLRTLFYGLTHEHSPGKLETLKRLQDTYEIVAIVDDRAATPCFFQTDPPALPEGVPVVGEKEAMDITGVDVGVFITVRPTNLVGGDTIFGSDGFHCFAFGHGIGNHPFPAFNIRQSWFLYFTRASLAGIIHSRGYNVVRCHFLRARKAKGIRKICYYIHLR